MSGASDRESAIRVLHVDDDPAQLRVTAAFLERNGMDVRSHTDVETALETLEEVDCVVSDYEMPERDGLDFLRAVRERDPDLPFILFTGKGSEEIASDAITAGVTDYLQKSRDGSQFELLVNRIRNVVEQARASEELARREQELALLFEQSPVGVIEWNLAFEVVRWNHAAAELFGYTAEEAKGRHASFIVPEEAAPHVDALWEDLVENVGGERSHNENVRKDGSLVTCEWHNRAIVDETGEVVSVLSMVYPAEE
ncbi:response regulator [Natronomonas sp. EA1]|uniref:PAS domain-containing protein n=1 Tax=Natronomonas sp. EA1 TaxID=3421655 RepID=UPI003EB85511